MPTAVVTEIRPVLAPEGTVAVIVVSPVRVKVAGVLLNRTAQAFVKFVPVIVTRSSGMPLEGENPVIDGAGGGVAPPGMGRGVAVAAPPSKGHRPKYSSSPAARLACVDEAANGPALPRWGVGASRIRPRRQPRSEEPDDAKIRRQLKRARHVRMSTGRLKECAWGNPNRSHGDYLVPTTPWP